MNHKVPNYVIFSIILPLFPHWTCLEQSHCVYRFVCEDKISVRIIVKMML
jgi:hypothetical protein